jgi:hypothetical protein
MIIYICKEEKVMKYAYEIIYGNGRREWSIQKYKFSAEEIVNAFKPYGVIKAKFHIEIPRGYHLCSCGNLAKGTSDELCDECREIYGHYYEHEL